jgi:hypothetical protein
LENEKKWRWGGGWWMVNGEWMEWRKLQRTGISYSNFWMYIPGETGWRGEDDIPLLWSLYWDAIGFVHLWNDPPY